MLVGIVLRLLLGGGGRLGISDSDAGAAWVGAASGIVETAAIEGDGIAVDDGGTAVAAAVAATGGGACSPRNREVLHRR